MEKNEKPLLHEIFFLQTSFCTYSPLNKHHHCSLVSVVFLITVISQELCSGVFPSLWDRHQFEFFKVYFVILHVSLSGFFFLFFIGSVFCIQNLLPIKLVRIQVFQPVDGLACPRVPREPHRCSRQILLPTRQPPESSLG